MGLGEDRIGTIECEANNQFINAVLVCCVERRRKVFSEPTFSSVDQPADYGAILLGTSFLNGLYSVFDADRKSLSFANRSRSGKS